MSRERIAQVLKECRKRSNLSVEEVSDSLVNLYQIDMAPRSLYSYESGHRQPDADLLMALCEIYGVTDIAGAFKEPNENEKKTSPPKRLRAEDLDDDALKAYKILWKLLGELGWLKPDGSITDKQADALISIINLLEYVFKPEE